MVVGATDGCDSDLVGSGICPFGSLLVLVTGEVNLKGTIPGSLTFVTSEEVVIVGANENLGEVTKLEVANVVAEDEILFDAKLKVGVLNVVVVELS